MKNPNRTRCGGRMLALWLSVGVILVSVGLARADTFLWNGDGVDGGVSNALLDNPALRNTWSNSGGPTATVPGILDTASLVFSSTASLGQSAGLTIGSFSFGNLSGGTIVFSNTNTFTNFSAGTGTLIVTSGTTTVTDSFAKTKGSVILVEGGHFELPKAFQNTGTIIITGGTVKGGSSTFVASSGLVGLWHFDGDFNDSSGNNNHGSGVNGVNFNTATPLLGSGAASFNGVNQYINIPDNVTLRNASFSVLGWFNTSLLNSARGLVAKVPTAQRWRVFIQPSGANWVVEFDGYPGEYGNLQSGILTTNQWYHFVATYDSVTSIQRLYLNGVEVGTATVAAANMGGTTAIPIQIGRVENSFHYRGFIDEVAIFNRAISASEVTAYYNGGSGVVLSDSYIKSFLSSGSFVNSATGHIMVAGGTLDLASSPFVNFGTMDVNSVGKAILGSVLGQNGVIMVDKAEVAGTQAWTNNGSIVLSNGSISGSTLTNSATLSGVGALSAALVNSGVVRLDGGSLQLTSASPTANTGTILVGANLLDVTANWVSSGNVIIEGGSIRTGGGAGTFTNTNNVFAGSSINSNFVNAGNFTLTSHVSITGNFTNAAGGRTTLNTYDLDVQGALGVYNAGTFTINGGNFEVTGAGQFRNVAGGFIDINSGGEFLISGGSPVFTFNNEGYISLSGAGDSLTVTGATLSPASTSRFRVNTGAVLDLSSGGGNVFNNTPAGGGSFEMYGGTVIINGSITNQGVGGSFTLANNLYGSGTFRVVGGTLTGPSNAFRFIGAKNGTLTIDMPTPITIQNVHLGPSTFFPSSHTITFTNSFTFGGFSSSNPAHIQPSNQTFYVANGAGTISLISGPGAWINMNGDPGLRGVIVGAMDNHGALRIGDGGGANGYTITGGFVNRNTGSVQYFAQSTGMSINANVTNYGTFIDARGTIIGNVANVGTWNEGAGGNFFWNGVLTNQGYFSKSSNNTMVLNSFGAGSRLENEGRVEITSGTLDLRTATLLNSGTINVAASTTLLLGTVTSHTGTISVGSNARLSGSRSWANDGYVALTSGSTLQIAANTTFTNAGVLELTGAGVKTLVGGDGFRTNSGTVRVTGGTLMVNPFVAGIVGLWHFDGNFNDSSGNNNHGSGVNGVNFNTATPLLGSGAASFNGVNQYINIPNNISLQNPSFSVEGWFNTTLGPGAHGLVSKANTGQRWRVFIQPSGANWVVEFDGYPGEYGNIQTGLLSSNQWYHFVATYDSVTSIQRLYLNGVEVGTATVAAANMGGTTAIPIEIGRVEGGNYYRGFIDEVAVFNRALSVAEVAAHYNGGNGLVLSESVVLASIERQTLTNNAGGQLLVDSGVFDLTFAPLQNAGILSISNGGMVVASTISSQTGTVTVTDSILAVQSAWTNNGYVALSHGEIRMLNNDTFYNYNRVNAGSSISGNFFNAGTFTLTDNTSITGNFTNAGWTTLGTVTGHELKVQGTLGTTNSGTIVTNLGTLHSINGLTNNLDALIQLAGGGIAGGSITNSGSIAGKGVIGTTLTNNAGGAVTASGGTLSFTQKVTNNGSMRLDFPAESFFDIFAQVDIPGGSIFGKGTMNFLPSGNGTFSTGQTQSSGLGGSYDTRSITFHMPTGTMNVEVTSTDLGSSAFSQFSNGFALGTLTLPNTLSLLRLLDDSINQGGGTQEAIYVHNLMLGSALSSSNFDFGAMGLKIYYNHIIGDGGANFVGTYDGAERVVYFGNIIPMSTPVVSSVVPEPSTLALLLLGLPVLWFVWRRRPKKSREVGSLPSEGASGTLGRPCSKVVLK